MAKTTIKDICSKLSEIYKRSTRHSCGHVHFYYKGMMDHIVLVCAKGKLRQIIAKDKDCKEKECKDWLESEFRDYSPEEAFSHFSDDISEIRTDDRYIQKSWDSMAAFLKWIDDVLK